jgi:hypothetical protein
LHLGIDPRQDFGGILPFDLSHLHRDIHGVHYRQEGAGFLLPRRRRVHANPHQRAETGFELMPRLQGLRDERAGQWLGSSDGEVDRLLSLGAENVRSLGRKHRLDKGRYRLIDEEIEGVR